MVYRHTQASVRMHTHTHTHPNTQTKTEQLKISKVNMQNCPVTSFNHFQRVCDVCLTFLQGVALKFTQPAGGISLHLKAGQDKEEEFL